jgi:hypothetical protein
MERKKERKRRIRMNKILGEFRNYFQECSLARNLAKGRFGKLL